MLKLAENYGVFFIRVLNVAMLLFFFKFKKIEEIYVN